MPWISVNFSQNTNIESTGTASAVFEDDDKTIFTFADTRSDVSAAKQGTFVDRAKAALSAWQASRSKQKTLEAELLAKLNA